MEKLKLPINSEDDYNRLLNTLSIRIKNNQPISDNGMYDGMIISFMIDKDRFVYPMLKGEYLDRVLDGTIQQLEHVIAWLFENDDKLCKIFKQ